MNELPLGSGRSERPMMSASNKMISDFMAIAERTAVVGKMWAQTTKQARTFN